MSQDIILYNIEDGKIKSELRLQDMKRLEGKND